MISGPSSLTEHTAIEMKRISPDSFGKANSFHWLRIINTARNEDHEEMKCHPFGPFEESTQSNVEEKRRQEDEKRKQIKSTVEIEGGFACCGKWSLTVHFPWPTCLLSSLWIFSKALPSWAGLLCLLIARTSFIWPYYCPEEWSAFPHFYKCWNWPAVLEAP